MKKKTAKHQKNSSLQRNSTPLRSHFNFFTRVRKISSLRLTKATHSAVVFLKTILYSLRLILLLRKKIGPFYSPDGSLLEFVVLGDRNNFIDLQRTRLEILAGILQKMAMSRELMLQRQCNETA